jgi:hypothetical protein
MCLCSVVLCAQKSELTVALNSPAGESGESNSANQNASVVLESDLQKRLELKEEEVRLYRSKYEECNKQLLQAVSTAR